MKAGPIIVVIALLLIGGAAAWFTTRPDEQALRFQGYRSEASVQRFGTVVVEGSRTVCDPHGRWAYSEPHAPAVFVSYMRSPDAARLN